MDKHYDFKTIEKQMQNLWTENKTYHFTKDASKPLYSIDTPPPTVNGSLHIGHIFSYAQAEMIARFKRMQGFNIFYPFGFDDNGLPTERLVEKELGIRAGQMPRSEFGDACIRTTQKYEADFRALWTSLGFSCDWTKQYETISPSSQRISQRSFIELYNKGKAYVKDSPVLWCTECKTSIAQAELETLEKETIFYTLQFRLPGTTEIKDGTADTVSSVSSDASDNSDATILHIATTRPELLYGCVSLFVHPDDARFKHLIGKSARVPLYDFDIPILADKEVSMDKGTGIVMCATFGDATDVTWTQTHNLEYKRIIEPDGTIQTDVPYIGGLYVTKARTAIVELLKARHLIEKEEAISHFVGIHERCGKTTEIMPSRQWYIDILTDKERFLKAADEINWYPEHMKNRYINWVDNLKWDWCVSRQRYFGVPIPVWYCSSCGTPMIAAASQLPVNPLESKPLKACACGCHEFEPETGVLDTWVTSSVTPQINALWGEEGDWSHELLPMSMRTQAHEIIRTWSFYTIVKSLYHTGQLPWKDLMICGFVLAKKGEKISKSKNNATQSPPELITTHSADAIRYWAAGAKLGTDTFFDADELTISKRLINKLWNASKFCFAQLDGFEYPVDELQLGVILPADRWILERLQETFNQATEALNQYEIGTARHHIDAFFWNDFCDNYLELAKERLYQPEKHGFEAQKSGQYAIYNCLLGILKLYAPYMPHITEYLYQELFLKHSTMPHSLHINLWPKTRIIDKTLINFGEEIKTALTEARRFKSENNLSMKSEMPYLEIKCSVDTKVLFMETLLDIKACTNAEEIVTIIV